jgi:hypothetical protein
MRSDAQFLLLAGNSHLTSHARYSATRLATAPDGPTTRLSQTPEAGFGVWLEPQLPGDSFLLLEQ